MKVHLPTLHGFSYFPIRSSLNAVSNPVVSYRQLLKAHFVGITSIRIPSTKLSHIKISCTEPSITKTTSDFANCHQRHTYTHDSQTWLIATTYNPLNHQRFQTMISTQPTSSPRSSTSKAPTASTHLVVYPAPRDRIRSISPYGARNGGRCCKNMPGKKKS